MDTIILTCGEMKLLRGLEKVLLKDLGYLPNVVIGTGFYTAVKPTSDKFLWYRGLSQTIDLELDNNGDVHLIILSDLTPSIKRAVWELLFEDYNSVTKRKITPKIMTYKVGVGDSTNLPLSVADISSRIGRLLYGKGSDSVEQVEISFVNNDYVLSSNEKDFRIVRKV